MPRQAAMLVLIVLSLSGCLDAAECTEERRVATATLVYLGEHESEGVGAAIAAANWTLTSSNETHTIATTTQGELELHLEATIGTERVVIELTAANRTADGPEESRALLTGATLTLANALENALGKPSSLVYGPAAPHCGEV